MIFLSYAKEDGARAAKIFSVLSSPNRAIFYDKDSLLPGMDWRFEIEEKVRKCSLMIILLSKTSVSKEGFVQREIKLALDRAEMMPEGRIFIIPVRLDDVELPQKLAKYHWLNMPTDDDVFDLEFSINVAEGILSGKTKAGQQVETDQPFLTRSLLREKVVILLQGKNPLGEQIFSYLKLALWKLQELRDHMREQKDFLPDAFGQILAQGKGLPDDKLREAMEKEHNMVDVPTREKREQEIRLQAERDFISGYAEAYRSCMGADAIPPELARPLPMFKPSSALREGITKGLEIVRSNQRQSEPPPPTDKLD